MNRYIIGKPVLSIEDITDSRQNYILIFDEQCFTNLHMLAGQYPTAILLDYKFAFTHIPSFFQMLSIPLFFIPENKNFPYEIFCKNSNTLTLSEIYGESSIVIDTIQNIVYPGHKVSTLANCCPKIDFYSDFIDSPFKVFSSIKGSNVQYCKDVEYDGVGLISTEFLFFDYLTFPDHIEQHRVLKRIMNSTLKNSKEFTIRLFDINSDKVPKWLLNADTTSYSHPLLEQRFSRFLNEQIRCLCELEQYPICILIPYVQTVDDIEYIKERIYSLSDHRPLIKVGAMIETLTGVKNLRAIRNAVDFLSIGSNDLVQSFLGFDRTQPYTNDQIFRISEDIAFWEMLSEILYSANSTPVRICGQLPIFFNSLERLLHIGYQQFTVSPQWIRQLKYQIHTYRKMRNC